MGKLYAAETIYYISILWDVGVITLFYHRYKSLKWWKEFVDGFIRMADDGWQQGWHERNGGNLSFRGGRDNDKKNC